MAIFKVQPTVRVNSLTSQHEQQERGGMECNSATTVQLYTQNYKWKKTTLM